MRDRIDDIIKNWSIEDCEIMQVYDTSWQIGDRYILKVYDSEKMLERNIKIVSILGDMNIPVGRLVFTKENTAFVKEDEYYYILSEKLSGSNIISIRDRPWIGDKMGKILSNLHIAFKECEK